MFKSHLTAVIFILLFSLPPIYGDFDYMQLVLTWPASFCYRPRYLCKRTAPNNFTIHGLWPDNEQRRLQFCTSTEYSLFDGDILDDLDRHWIQLKFDKETGMQDQPLWHEQFRKHGTCCENRYKQMPYFLLAMRLKNKFDLLTTLRTHGIIPGTKHTFDEIQKAIKTVTNQVDPDLKCVQHIQGVPELNEIGICFTPAADRFFPCPQSKSCPKTGTKILFR
uniref:S10-ribonuclease n=1 Tax=Petunia hybrida TaxID=4102 RepID=Q00591_PETHY|nr:Sx-protein [Petunia x hybrida]BAQ19083.1 S10-ribonuclease precursor [Petunia x hybrida]